MGQTGKFRGSVSIATESSYGSLDSDGLPSTGGLSFAALEVTRDSITYDGQDEPALMRDVASATPGALPPEVIAPYSSGSPVQYRAGTHRLVFPGVRCPGSGTVDDLALGRILRTVMIRRSQSAGVTDTVAAGSPTANTWTATSGVKYNVGDVVASVIDGTLQFARVTNKSGTAITVSPAFSSAPAVGATIRMCQHYAPTFGTLDFSTHPSLATRIDTQARRQAIVGGRLQSLGIELGDNRVPVPTATMIAPWIQDADGSAEPADAAAPGGPFAQQMQSLNVWASLAAETSPAAAGHNILAVKRYSLQLDWGLAPGADFMADAIVGTFDARLTMTVEPNGTLEAIRRAGNAGAQVQLMLGHGPAGGAGSGFFVSFAAAHLLEYARPTVGDRETLVDLTWGLSRYTLDAGAFQVGQSVDNSFSMGWVS